MAIKGDDFEHGIGGRCFVFLPMTFPIDDLALVTGGSRFSVSALMKLFPISYVSSFFLWILLALLYLPYQRMTLVPFVSLMTSFPLNIVCCVTSQRRFR